MEHNDQERQIERWLDSTLQQYGRSEPRTGLEGRILANLQSAEKLPQRRWWPALAAAAAILVLGGVVVMGTHTSSAPETATRQWQTLPSVAAAPVIASAPSEPGGHAGQRKVVRAQVEPRLQQFPSPQPLSPQEKALVRYFEDRPAEAKQMAQAQTELMQEEARKFAQQTPSPFQDSPQ